MPTLVMNKIDPVILIELIHNEKIIGCAKLIQSSNTITLTWIEIISAKQRLGYGSMIMDFIIDELVTDQLPLKINIVDDEATNFYIRYFLKRGVSITDVNDWLNDSPIHPTLLIQKNLLPFASLPKKRGQPF